MGISRSNANIQLRHEIKDKGITYRNIAKVLGISRYTLSRWFRYELDGEKKEKIVYAISWLEEGNTGKIHAFDESPDFTEDMPFGEILRKARRLSGLNQSQLGEIIGLDQQTISRYENGKSSPPVDYAVSIFLKLGYEFEYGVKKI